MPPFDLFKALLLCCVFGAGQPVYAEATDCSLAQSVTQLRTIYYAMIGRPEAPAVRDVARYVQPYAEELAKADPSLTESLEDLTRLAAELQRTARSDPLDDTTRQRHFESAARLTSAAAPECLERKDRPPKGGLDPLQRAAINSSQHGKSDAHLWLSVEEAVERVLKSVARAVAAIDPVKAAIFAVGVALLIGAAFALDRLQKGMTIRSFERHPFNRFVDLMHDGRTVTCAAADLSRSGIKVAWTEAPKADARVSLALAGRTVPGRVVWQNAHFCGVEFDQPLTAAEFSRALSGGPGVSTAPVPA